MTKMYPNSVIYEVGTPGWSSVAASLVLSWTMNGGETHLSGCCISSCFTTC